MNTKLNMEDKTNIVNAYLENLEESKRDVQEVIFQKRQNFCLNKVLAYWFPEFTGMVWIKIENNQLIFVTAFSGRRTKPDIHGYCRGEDEAKSSIEKWANYHLSVVAKKAAKKAELKTATNENVKIGDVFYSSWGYEQTNVDYYQVVGIKGKASVELREIAGAIVENGRASGTIVPVVDHFISDEIISRRLNHSGHIKIDRVQIATKKEYQLVDGEKIFKADYWSSDY